MDGQTLARVGAVIFVALVLTATAIEMARKTGTSVELVTAPAKAVAERDPLDAELARCSQEGEAGPRDPDCLKAWAENRRRFLGQDRGER